MPRALFPSSRHGACRRRGGFQAPFRPLAELDRCMIWLPVENAERLALRATSGGAAKGSKRKRRKAAAAGGGRALALHWSPLFGAALTLFWKWAPQTPRKTNRPVAYAPAEKERSANANAIKFAADLLAGGVAGGISKTGAFSSRRWLIDGRRRPTVFSTLSSFFDLLPSSSLLFFPTSSLFFRLEREHGWAAVVFPPRSLVLLSAPVLVAKSSTPRRAQSVFLLFAHLDHLFFSS